MTLFRLRSKRSIRFRLPARHVIVIRNPGSDKQAHADDLPKYHIHIQSFP